MLRRLDRMNRHMERIEREAQVSVEALAIFVRAWLTSTPRLSAEDRAAAQAVGSERYGTSRRMSQELQVPGISGAAESRTRWCRRAICGTTGVVAAAGSQRPSRRTLRPRERTGAFR